MPEDPRVRLTGLTSDKAAAPVLAALDDITVDVVLGTDVHPSARLAAAATAAIAARLFREVTVHGEDALPPNWWDAPTIGELVGRLGHPQAIQPATPAARRLVLTFGAALPPNVTPTVGVGGGDYLARLGTDPQPVHPGEHALGVHAAGCLAIGQLLGQTLSRVAAAPAPAPLPARYALNLLTHRLMDDSADNDTGQVLEITAPRSSPLHVVFAGAGSVASSGVALLSMACAGTDPGAVNIEVVDDDDIDPARNVWRYPALVGGETGSKAQHLASRLRAMGLRATGQHETVTEWARSQPDPGLDGLLVSSVDTLTGRLQVADVLARQTLSLGVSGTSLHAQREGLGDGYACPYCDYVSAAPVLTQADVYAATTGLDLNRVLQLLQHGAHLTDGDVAQAAAAGKVPPARATALVGRSLHDLVRQAYAEVQVTAVGGDVIAVASPHVSWFAGVLAAVEIIKEVTGRPLLDRRVDADLAGLPPGLVRRMPADPSGRCVCRSGVRRRWHGELYGAA